MDQLMSESTKLRVALTTRIRAIMRDSSATGIFKGEILQTHLLHKARLRIGFELNSCLATADIGSNVSGSILDYEINWAALTIAHAMVNPYYMDWDVDRFAEMAKVSQLNRNGSVLNTDQQQKYLLATMIGKISVPATIKQSWQSQGFIVPEEGGEFGAGRITVSPAFFMQRHERLQDPMVTSASYKSVEVQEWLATLSAIEFFWNVITTALAPDLFEAGASAITQVV
ncbi:hypothetical protein BDR04DRAFT_1117271 [Suillus decipiens]|nr:hypothetical protein BDR04DRAFT_1117271 [Suillus decipiens]